MPLPKYSRMPPADRQRVTISGLTYGPHGVGRLASGKAVFVRGVAPGEEVEVVVTEDRKNFVYADLAAVVGPSQQRRTPPCEYLPGCGGCPWQHLTYAAQLHAKEQSVRDALTRIGKLDASLVQSILPSPLEFGYRNRLNLRVDGHEIGFYRGGTHALVPISHCLLAEAEVDRAIEAARALVRCVESKVRRIEIVARGRAPGVVLHGEVEGELSPRDEERAVAFLDSFSDVSGIVLQGHRWRTAWGDVMVRVTPADGAEVTLPAGAFSQVNPRANRQLVELVLAFAGLRGGDRVLELHAGAGNLTLPLAAHAGQVVAVEQDKLAAAAAAENTRALSNVEVRNLSAAQAVTQCAARGENFDLVVLDPPRSGAPEAVKGLLDIAARRLVYVSCNPSTLARDLARLARRYRIEAVQPIDMFPHTYHVETVVRTVLT
jgi:23S rRNA (uracil1939-C5)-methyltransferase